MWTALMTSLVTLVANASGLAAHRSTWMTNIVVPAG
jgi:hypothetical protein